MMLELRLNRISTSLAVVSVYDEGGWCGELLLSRSTWDELIETAELDVGDYLKINTYLKGVTRALERG